MHPHYGRGGAVGSVLLEDRITEDILLLSNKYPQLFYTFFIIFLVIFFIFLEFLLHNFCINTLRGGGEAAAEKLKTNFMLFYFRNIYSRLYYYNIHHST